jgi:hypothetical protein
MEPERPIEKLLRASAKKRREEAGPPFEMHPATRRLLQGEVKREVKPRGQGTESGRPSAGLWRRLGWSLGILIILGLAASLFMPEFYRPRPQATGPARSVDNLASIETKARPTEEPLSGRAAGAAAVDKRSLDLADGDVANRRAEVAQAPAAAAAAAPQAGAPLNKPTPATGAPAVLAASEFDAVAKQNLESKAKSAAPAPATALAETARSVPPSRADASLADEFRAGAKTERESNALAFGVAGIPTVTTNAVAAFKNLAAVSQTQRFRRIEESSQVNGAAFRKRSTATTGVLTNFELVQADRQLRIVDSDGSIYTGNLQAVQTAFRVPAVPPPSAEDRAKDQVRLQPEPAPMAFVVIGTNRTLNLPVVFSGTFAFPANTAVSGQLTASNAPVARSFGGGAARLPSLSTSRISGSARVGNAQVIPVEAVPAEK